MTGLKKFRAALLASVLAVAAGSAAQAEGTRLQGKLFIGGFTMVDPPPDEPKNTHAGFWLEGKAAMVMYRTMKGKAQPDACHGPGWLSKYAGSAQCAYHPVKRKATCNFTLSLVDGKTHHARQAC